MIHSFSHRLASDFTSRKTLVGFAILSLNKLFIQSVTNCIDSMVQVVLIWQFCRNLTQVILFKVSQQIRYHNFMDRALFNRRQQKHHNFLQIAVWCENIKSKRYSFWKKIQSLPSHPLPNISNYLSKRCLKHKIKTIWSLISKWSIWKGYCIKTFA